MYKTNRTNILNQLLFTFQIVTSTSLPDKHFLELTFVKDYTCQNKHLLEIFNQIFCYTRSVTPKIATSLRGVSPHRYAWAQLSSYRRNVAAVAIRWQQCV